MRKNGACSLQICKKLNFFCVKFGATGLQSQTFLARIWVSVGLRGIKEHDHNHALVCTFPHPWAKKRIISMEKLQIKLFFQN